LIELVAIILFVFFVFVAIVFVFNGSTVWDRLLGFNVCTSKVIMIILLIALLSNNTFLLDAAIIYSLVGFVSTIFICRLVANRTRREKREQ